jgi:hypothetical protein
MHKTVVAAVPWNSVARLPTAISRINLFQQRRILWERGTNSPSNERLATVRAFVTKLNNKEGEPEGSPLKSED